MDTPQRHNQGDSLTIHAHLYADEIAKINTVITFGQVTWDGAVLRFGFGFIHFRQGIFTRLIGEDDIVDKYGLLGHLP